IGQDGLHLAAAMVQRAREEECRDDGDSVEPHLAVVTLVDMHRDDAVAMAARRRRLRFARAAPIAARVLEPLALPEPLRICHDMSPFIGMITRIRRSRPPPWPRGPAAVGSRLASR